MKLTSLFAAVLFVFFTAGCRKPEFRKEFSYGKHQFVVSISGDVLYLTGKYDGTEMTALGGCPLNGETFSSAEVADLNSDGYPEVYAFTKAAGDLPGTVRAYACKEKACSSIGIDWAAAVKAEGYCGGDAYRLEKDALVREYDVCGKKDAPAAKTARGEVRYKLGENSFGYILAEAR